MDEALEGLEAVLGKPQEQQTLQKVLSSWLNKVDIDSDCRA